jgi:hypothetical protein
MNDVELLRDFLRTNTSVQEPARNSDHPAKTYNFASLADFAAHDYPAAEPLLGEPGASYLTVGGLLLCYGAEASGKSTWTVDGVAHLGAGEGWLGLPVPRPVRFLVIENEGPPALFQAKLAAKRESWEGRDFGDNVHVFEGPWGDFTFADPGARRALTAYCDEHDIDVVCANPTLALGVGTSGKPDETQEFVGWLEECGLWGKRAFWLLHHRNKAAQVSGDWGRHPDTMALLEPDGNRQRTKLTWEKTRWATLGTEERPRSLMLDWETATESYTVSALDTVGASDEELVGRLVAYLEEHPATSTRRVVESVKGTNAKLQRLLEEREEFDHTEGPRGAKLWMTSTTVSEGAPT